MSKVCDDVLAELHGLIRRSIAERVFPGAVAYVSRGGRVVWHEAFGRTTYRPSSSTPSWLTDRFDLASVTKLYTTALALRLVEKGLLSLADPVRRHVPEVQADWTLEDLLAHRTGMTADLLGWARACGVRPCEPDQAEALWAAIFSCTPEVKLAAGQSYYSDVDFLLVGRACERAAGVGLAELMASEVIDPLGLGHTGFCPPRTAPCVPTEIDDRWGRGLLEGQVHDEIAATLGGAAGHAGLFSTAEEVGKFCEAWLPTAPDSLLAEETRRLELQAHSDHFGLGWRLCDAAFFPSLQEAGAVGHLGFTGTSAFLFPETETVFVLLSNRVYPRRDAAPTRLPLVATIAEHLGAVPA